MAKRTAPEVNAGSMADIAFLLLIFFLVTTTIETDKGISRKLPPIQDENVEPPIIKQKNIFTVIVNRDNQLLVEDQPMKVKDLRAAAVKFLDNGAGLGEDGCSYCQGAKDPTSSDNPTKAIISLVNDRKTEYRTYISVQNELVAAYNELRNQATQKLYGQNYLEMERNYNDPSFRGNKETLKERLDKVKDMYPQKLSEAEPKG